MTTAYKVAGALDIVIDHRKYLPWHVNYLPGTEDWGRWAVTEELFTRSHCKDGCGKISKPEKWKHVEGEKHEDCEDCGTETKLECPCCGKLYPLTEGHGLIVLTNIDDEHESPEFGPDDPIFG